jgi:type IV pilus assembly protein PilO
MAKITIDSIVRLPRLQKVGMLCGAVALILGLYWFLVYRDYSAKLDARQAILTKKQQELNEQMVILADLPKFRKETADMKGKRQKALEQLPNEKDIDKLLEDISSLAIESGLEILLFKPQQEVKRNFYAEIPVELKLSGGYHDLALFYDKIASLPRIVNVSDMLIEKPQEVDGRNILQASCTAKTYKFIEEKPGEQDKQDKKKKK